MTTSGDRLVGARLGIGCAKLGEATNDVSWGQAIRILRDAADGGITYFDTADAYTSGTSEMLIGQAFRGCRDDVTIATKAGFTFRERTPYEARVRFLVGPIIRRIGQRAIDTTTSEAGKYEQQSFEPRNVRAALEGSLRRLRTDHVDVFHLHAPGGAQLDMDGLRALASDLVEEGKIGEFGVALERAEDVARWIRVDEVGVIQLPFGVLDQTAADVVHRAGERGISVVARGVLGGGRLLHGAESAPLRELAARRQLSLAELAIAFVAGHPDVDVALIGIRVRRHLDDLLALRAAAQPGRELYEEVSAAVEAASEGGAPAT